jgi:serine/threonine-protein kinase
MSNARLRQQAEARVGRVLRGKWRLDRVLGVGGLAAVYAATHRAGKRVAIKVLHAELSVHDEVRTRFLREAYVANRVDHPGAVSISDDEVAEDGTAFLVMDLLEGETLETYRRRKGGSLPPEEVLAVAEQVLDVLAAAHGRGIVHRDLKPENLFLTRAGDVKVLDFGIARLHDPSLGEQVTQSGLTLGTPAFMPPEQARGRPELIDGRTDLWGVGAVMFMLLSGQRVHAGETMNEVLVAAMTAPARPLASVVPGVAAAIARLVDRALAFEKEARWPDARAMQWAVQEARAALAAAEWSSPVVATVPLLPAPFTPRSPGEAEDPARHERGAAAGGSTGHTWTASEVATPPASGVDALLQAAPPRARRPASLGRIIALAAGAAMALGAGAAAVARILAAPPEAPGLVHEVPPSPAAPPPALAPADAMPSHAGPPPAVSTTVAPSHPAEMAPSASSPISRRAPAAPAPPAARSAAPTAAPSAPEPSADPFASRTRARPKR